eukprot:3527625-Karenia_brevis.AAC.1
MDISGGPLSSSGACVELYGPGLGPDIQSCEGFGPHQHMAGPLPAPVLVLIIVKCKALGIFAARRERPRLERKERVL